jgi:hypothetical protein
LEISSIFSQLVLEIFGNDEIGKNRLLDEPSGERLSDYYNTVKEFSFSTQKHQYVSEYEFFDNDIITVSFYAKLPEGYEKNKYAYLSDDPEHIKVMNTVFYQVYSMMQENKSRSFVFLGGADVVGDDQLSMDNTKRYRIYRMVANKLTQSSDFQVVTDPHKSAIAVVSLKKLAEVPDLMDKINLVIRVHF